MSLKAFHLVFVTVLTLLTLGFTVWAFLSERPVWGVAGIITAGLVIYYGIYFLKKLKNVSYL